MKLEIVLNFRTKTAVLSSKAAEKHLATMLSMTAYKNWTIIIH